MIDIKWIRENKQVVKENISKKFQDEKLPLVDEVEKLDIENRALKQRADQLRADRNQKSTLIGSLLRNGDKEEAEKIKKEVSSYGDEIVSLEKREDELSNKIKEMMMKIPQIIDDSVPIGKDDSENVEIEKFGEPFIPNY